MSPLDLKPLAAAIGGSILLGAVVTSACSTSRAPPAAPEAASVDDDVADALLEHHRYHHHGGLILLLAMSLDTLGVAPEQRTAVDAARADLQSTLGPARDAERALTTKLAAGVVAGAIDANAVTEAIARLTAEAASATQAAATPLDVLHRALTPPERGALVDKLAAHWSVWEAANADETKPAKPGEGALGVLALDLDLTAEQVDQLRASLQTEMAALPHLDLALVANQLQIFGEAFRGEAFDARKLTGSSAANAAMVGWGAAHLARFVEVITPTLTVAQRGRFAETLLSHAGHDPSGEARR